MVKPSQLKEEAQQAVKGYPVSIRIACAAVGISETCYRYQAKLSEENTIIADWLVVLTQAQHN